MLVEACGNSHVILGGDLNCTPSPSPPHLNPDLEFHVSPCNQTGSNCISNMMKNKNLIDVYRFIWSDKKSFSFERKFKHTVSRSRIDFFLASSDLSKFILDAEYSHTPKMFDHFLCTFRLGKGIKKTRKCKSIDPLILTSDEFQRQCLVETINFVQENYDHPPLEISERYQLVNIINAEIISIDKYLSTNFDKMLYQMKADRIERFDSFSNVLLSSIEQFQPNENFSPSIHLLTLINNFKNIAHNLTASKVNSKKFLFEKLKSKLESTRQNEPHNQEKINELSEKLSTLTNLETNGIYFNSSKTNSRWFEKDISIISNNISNICNTPLTVVMDEQNEKFESKNAQNKYIYDYYSNLYNCNSKSTGSISSFLDGIPHPQLSNDHINLLESDFTFKDLEEVINSLKSNCSPGIDNISNSLIKVTYPYAKSFMLRSYNAIKNGLDSAPTEFKSSYIKLIPKRGSLKNLKNWRPICISPGLFKVYCKLLTLKLKVILPDILGTSQKAYLNDRAISDTTLNTLLRIATSNLNNLPMFSIAIDFVKAFDMLLHDFILKVLSQFGFPISFINSIKSWLSNRLAALKIDGDLTKFFNIRIGTPQGDPLSGYLFLLCIEILLLKLKHSSDLNLNMEEDSVLPNNADIGNTESFADDINLFIPANEKALKTTCNILDEFKKLSGLKINETKTVVLISGCNDHDNLENFENLISLYNFSVVKSFKHLGIEIYNDFKKLDENWISKMKKTEILKNLFFSINPTIPCKIDIIKSFLLSQFTYICSVLSCSNENIKIIEEMICSFINHGIVPLKKTQIFTPKESGGLGIPPIKNFFLSLLTKTAIRAANSDQMWARYFRSLFHFDSLKFVTKYDSHYKIFNDLAMGLDKFKTKYFSNDNRIWSCNIFSSNVILNPDSHLPLSVPDYLKFNTFFYNLRVKDLLLPKSKKLISYGNFVSKFNTEINFNTYYNIYRSLNKCLQNYELPNTDTKEFSIEAIFYKNPKAKFIRSFFEYPKLQIESSQSYIYYSNITSVPFNFTQSSTFYSIWTLRFLHSSIREFSLRKCNNRIVLNGQLAHLNRNVSPYCTFCTNENDNNKFKETFAHLFFDCKITKTIIMKYFQKYLSCDWCNHDTIFRGHLSDNKKEMIYVNIDITILLYFVYQSRCTKKIPTFQSIYTSLCFTKKLMIQTDSFYRKIVNWAARFMNENVLEHIQQLDKIY